MADVSDRHKKREIEKSKKMLKLIESETFQELIMDGFIKNGILEQGLQQSLDNDKTIDEIKARQILNQYIFAIITTGEILSS